MVSQIVEQVLKGQRLDFEQGLALYQKAEIWQLARLAGEITRSRHDSNVYYCINRHINYTNVCRNQCPFCGFSRRPGQVGGYVLSVNEILELVSRARQDGATEIHIVGGVNPELEYDYYLGMIERIHGDFPYLHIKAFTAVEIIDLAEKSGYTIERVLTELKAAGLGTLPGGGAEILDEDYYRKTGLNKSTPNQWLDVHTAAHGLGMMTNATMLYGYRDSAAHRIRHLIRLRQQQDESIQADKGRFLSFVPLPYVPPKSSEDDIGKIDALIDLKTIAICRLMLDNFAYIKAFWPMLGVKLAQIALSFGANDLDGTVQQYRIVDTNKDNPDDSLTKDELEALIIEADGTPIQRDGFYHEYKNQDAHVSESET